MKPAPTRTEFTNIVKGIFEGTIPSKLGGYNNERETHGKNRSPKLDKLIKSQGGSLGDAYCLWGQQYLLDAVCEHLGIARKTVMIPEGGGTQKTVARTPARFVTMKRKPGCMITWRNGKTGLGHVEFVCGDAGANGFFPCIGFNTTVDGDDNVVRDGQGCGYTSRVEDPSGALFLLGYTDVYAAVIEAMGVKGAAPTDDNATVDAPFAYDHELLQVRLLALGFDPGPIDGKPGLKSTAAVKKFQLAYLPGSKGTGRIGPATVTMLEKLAKTPTKHSELPVFVGYRAAWKNEEWTQIVAEALEAHGKDLLSFAQPKDAEAYGFKARTREERKAFYIMLISLMALRESSFNPDAKYNEKGHLEGVTSRGLLQISLGSGRSYNKALKKEADLHDPKMNLETGVMILNRWIPNDGYIGTNKKGGAKYWAVLREHSKSRLKIQTAMKAFTASPK